MKNLQSNKLPTKALSKEQLAKIKGGNGGNDDNVAYDLDRIVEATGVTNGG